MRILAVACLMERLGENMVDRQEDSYVERILIAMHMSFTCPDSAFGQVENINDELPPCNTARNTQVEGMEPEKVI